ncbi:glycosyltransferase involved in cell wall biosynthesis [Algoriphagus boseongensis]|uniref:Glycosyltransferase involved in cell wall biosynthesis n=1 Tax=Algoriphagus boseongensis TaxID=1442587 RepID=A0A4R6TD17_9BACT|nr:glycosyltransferase family 4 protein [Algoriphagus boseongensis]TDQ19635.1 glycosyltransferase involved in cell wall biosynthesis [Algoriphagus boseongensis]
MAKKILFFHLLNNFTGSPQVLRNVIEVAKLEGHQVELYTSSGTGFLSGISGIRYRSNFYYRSNIRLITLVTFFMSQVFLMGKLLRHRKEDCLFYVNTILPFSAIWMGKMLGKKVIVHVHEYEISPKILSRFLFWVVRSWADQIVVVSRFLAINPALGSRKSLVIHNSVKKEIEEEAVVFVPEKKSKSVLMLASLRPYKGIYEFVELAKRLPKLDFDLILSDSSEDVEKWKSGLNITPNLHIWPVQKEVVPWYKQAFLVLNLAHPDKWLETFGMTILEGMHFGVPAIVPTKGGVTELIEYGINGYLVDYTDLDKIEELIRKIDSSEELWKQLGAKAKEKAQDFTGRKFSSEIRNLLSA